METVHNNRNQDMSINRTQRDEMNNEISSTSREDHLTNGNTVNITQINTYNPSTNNYITKPQTSISNGVTKLYRSKVNDTAVSDTEEHRKSCKLKPKNHCKSMGNIHEAYQQEEQLIRVQNRINSIDLNLHSSDIKRLESVKIPIVGYEVMEERARFTIYKLKVENDNQDQSWLVFRRYTDFVRLYSRIKTEQPNLLLPLPGKRWFKNNFDPEFLDDRVRGLQIFVNAILDKLPNHPLVREFFCLDEPPQVFTYQPEVQAVYGALEDSIGSLRMQLKQKDATIAHLQKRLSYFEELARGCGNCRQGFSSNNS